MTGVRQRTFNTSLDLDAAACKGKTDMMFDTHHFGPALMLCRTCTVTDACFALWESLPSADQMHGVWFNTTPGQRKRSHRPRCGLEECEGRLTARQVTRGTQFCSAACSAKAQSILRTGVTVRPRPFEG